MSNCKRGPINAKGQEAARYFGAECEANPGSSWSDYAEDCASYYGKSKWRDLTPDEKAEALAAFNAGRKDERRLSDNGTRPR